MQFPEVPPQRIFAEVGADFVQPDILLRFLVAHGHMRSFGSVFHRIPHFLQLRNKSGKAVCSGHCHFHIGFHHAAQRGCAFFFVFSLAVGFPVSVCFHNRQSIFAAQFIGNSSDPLVVSSKIIAEHLPINSIVPPLHCGSCRKHSCDACLRYYLLLSAWLRFLAQKDALHIADKPACLGNTQHIAVGLHFQGKKMSQNPRILRKRSNAKQRTAGTAQMYLPFSFIFKIIETQRQ